MYSRCQLQMSSTYIEAFRGFCAHAHDYLFPYMGMSDVVDMSKVTTKSECPHRLYEASRVDHLQRGLKRALETFDMDTSLTDAEKTLIAKRVIPTLSQIQNTLYELNMLYLPPNLLVLVRKKEQYLSLIKEMSDV